MDTRVKLVENKANCCGCGACASACACDAVSMFIDDLGFQYPKVDYNKCINCGVCKEVCPVESDNRTRIVNKPAKTVYAASLRDSECVSKSASGGAFVGIAKFVLEQSGVVCGAAWDDDFSVRHICVDSFAELEKIQGSKYTQSNMNDIFTDIQLLLKSEKLVLFSGMPCQVAALRCFLKRDYDNLYTIDLICHGVGSPSILKDELKYQKLKNNAQLKAVSFRSKRQGWGTSGDLIFDNKVVPFNISVSPYYYYYYLENAVFRDSCYHCKYSSMYRPADLTIGDYWRIETAHPEFKFDIKKGVSCILINTEKGRRLLENVKDNFVILTSTLDKVMARNANLNHCCSEPTKRKLILDKYKSGYSDFYMFYKKDSRKKVISEKAKDIIPYRIKRFLKQIIK